MTNEEYARLWLAWQATGFDRKQCPWRNHREMRRHVPKAGAIASILLEEETESIDGPGSA